MFTLIEKKHNWIQITLCNKATICKCAVPLAYVKGSPNAGWAKTVDYCSKALIFAYSERGRSCRNCLTFLEAKSVHLSHPPNCSWMSETRLKISPSWAYSLSNVEMASYRLGVLIGYSVSSGKEKPIDALISISILKFIQIWVYGTKFPIPCWKG